MDYTDPLNRGLVAWWPFRQNGGNTLRDVVGGHHGDLDASMTSDDWIVSEIPATKALDFDGTDDTVIVPDSDKLSPLATTRQMTISYWFNDPGTAIVYALAKDNSGQAEWRITHNNNEAISWTATNLSGPDVANFFTSNSAYATNAWNHCVIVVDRDGDGFIYVNGVRKSGPNAMSSFAYTNGTGTFDFGGFRGASWYNGKIGDTRLYNRILSASEVHDLYVASRRGYPKQFKRRSVFFGAPEAATFNHWYARFARQHRIIGSGVHV